MKFKRFFMWCNFTHRHLLNESPTGDLMLFEDHLAYVNDLMERFYECLKESGCEDPAKAWDSVQGTGSQARDQFQLPLL